MPLFDHFHAPLSRRRHWDTFHGRWAFAIADRLNGGLLPEGYLAEGLVTLGQIEVDVATREEEIGNGSTSGVKPTSVGVATLAAPAWTPVAPTLELDAEFPDEIKVLIYSEHARSLVGAIELVSPSNKARPSARRAFAVKCLSYLQSQIGLIIVDIVTERAANLHNDLVELLGGVATFSPSVKIYSTAYRPVRQQNAGKIAVWPVELKVGEPLPVLPLWLRDQDDPVCVDLESTYIEACERCRIP